MNIAVRKLRKRLNGTEVYDDLTFTAKPGRITAVFGPNGSGKTTLFNILSGVLEPDGGEISIDATDGELGYLFQNYRDSLLPWRTGYDNLAFPLELRGASKEEIRTRISMLQRDAGVSLPLEKYPYEMSGGQQQMLAILRTLITSPRVLLLDEPFSALDYENALHQRDILQRYYLKNCTPVLIITHDIEEAVYLAEEIVILSHKPTRVLGVVKNPLPYPRTLTTLKSEEFRRATARVLRLFQQAMRA
jgi:NitT/TauT family transport system ATP-binding protein